MGGSPKGKDTPRPSYEDGELRDASIEAKVDPAVGEAEFMALVRRAAKLRSPEASDSGTRARKP